MHRTTATRTMAAATFAAVLAVTNACTGDSDERALEKITYLTSSRSPGHDAYAYVAKEKGYFAAAGFDVDITSGVSAGDTIKAVVGGQAQFAPVDLTAGLLAAGNTQGRPPGFTVVAGIQQRTLAAIVTLTGGGVTTPQDLEGKTLADTPGSVVRTLFRTYARLANVDAAKVTWVNGAAPTLVGTLVAGRVTGIGQSVVGKPSIESSAKGRRAVLLPYSEYLQDLYGNVLITSSSYARSQPEKVERFSAALLKGLTTSIADPAEAGRILDKYVPATTPSTTATEVRLMGSYVHAESTGVAVGALDRQRVARGIAILQGAGAIPAGLTPEQVIDFPLVPSA